jgi:hypothetical protein
MLNQNRMLSLAPLRIHNHHPLLDPAVARTLDQAAAYALARFRDPALSLPCSPSPFPPLSLFLEFKCEYPISSRSSPSFPFVPGGRTSISGAGARPTWGLPLPHPSPSRVGSGSALKMACQVLLPHSRSSSPAPDPGDRKALRRRRAVDVGGRGAGGAGSPIQ